MQSPRSLLSQACEEFCVYYLRQSWHGLCSIEYRRTLMFQRKDGAEMLWTILLVLLILWFLGLISGAVGNLIHILLVVALVVLIIQLITGRRAVV